MVERVLSAAAYSWKVSGGFVWRGMAKQLQTACLEPFGLEPAEALRL